MLSRCFDNKGKKIVYGKCSYEELEEMNIEKDFEEALKTLYHIRKSRKAFFDAEEPDEVNRKVYGRRKASRK